MRLLLPVPGKSRSSISGNSSDGTGKLFSRDTLEVRLLDDGPAIDSSCARHRRENESGEYDTGRALVEREDSVGSGEAGGDIAGVLT